MSQRGKGCAGDELREASGRWSGNGGSGGGEANRSDEGSEVGERHRVRPRGECPSHSSPLPSDLSPCPHRASPPLTVVCTLPSRGSCATHSQYGCLRAVRSARASAPMKHGDQTRLYSCPLAARTPQTQARRRLVAGSLSTSKTAGTRFSWHLIRLHTPPQDDAMCARGCEGGLVFTFS
jgi:hypothetical protein